jgi:5-(carboxyamino)imidazole ribonucleotide synthase
VYPPPAALEAAQDRLVEKRFFRGLGVPTPPFEPVESLDRLLRAVEKVGLPAVLKTRRLGYDGKGQRVLRRADDLLPAWEALGGVPLILEGFVPYERELSVIAARSRRGEIRVYPLAENHHGEGILRISIAPAPGLEPTLARRAEEYAAAALERLDYVGVLAIELFQAGGRLLVNEMAPRVHNSGHWTIEGAATSQFENHLRAVSGFPLGETNVLGHAAMVNLIGTLPAIDSLLAVPGARVHLYGKAPAPGRKLGHINFRCDTEENLRALIERVGALLPVTSK